MRAAWRAFRWAWRIAAVVVVAGSLAFSAAMATLAPVASVASGLAQRLFGHSAVSAIVDSRTRPLQARVDTLEAERGRLQDHNRRLARRATALEGDLARERTRAARLTSRIDGPSRRISERVFRATAREVGATGAEAIPLVGAFAGFALLAVEIRENCATIDDMNALREAAGAEPMTEGWFTGLCARLPGGAAAELESMTVPECRAQAEEAEAAILSREDTLLDDPSDMLRAEAARLRAEVDRVCDCFVTNPGRGADCVTELGSIP